jgi:signal recognition particle receptor subunit alpha
MSGPKKSITEKDMNAIDFSVSKEGTDDIDAKKKEFLGGDDDDLRQLGFYDSDDEIDFANFKIGNKTNEEVEDATTNSIFGRLTSAFKNLTGNKVLTKADIEPILKDFSNNLTDKNVSAEIAQEICKNVEQSLIGETTASFTSIKQTV